MKTLRPVWLSATALLLMSSAQANVSLQVDVDTHIEAVDHNLPMRRFALGAVSDSCVVVAIEIGGFGPHVEILAFKRGKNGWSSSLRGSQAEVPNSLRDFTTGEKP